MPPVVVLLPHGDVHSHIETTNETVSVKTTDLPGLHLFSAPSEGHIGVTGAGAVPFLLLDVVDESIGFAVFPLAAPVVKDLLDELVVLLQQQFGLRKAHQLRNTDRSYILISKMHLHGGGGDKSVMEGFYADAVLP